MILVDSSAWISWFTGRATGAASRIERALEENEPLIILDLVIAEVLQGFRSDRDFELARAALLGLPRPKLSVGTYVASARLYRRLRTRGITPRGVVDCIIAQTSIELAAPLLTEDADFLPIARHSKLKLERV